MMKLYDGMSQGTRVCAAVVLYRPDPALLARQAQGLRGRPVFAFANGRVDERAIEALAPTDLRVIQSPDNIGLGHGLNAVMKAAAGEGFSHVMLLDQDSEPSEGILDVIMQHFITFNPDGRKVAIIAPRLVPPVEGFYKPIRYEWRKEQAADGLAAVDFAPTSGSVLSTAAFTAIGPFRADFFIAGIDVEWGFRAWDRGWGSYVATTLAMPHRWGEAIGPEEMGKAQILRHSPIRNYYYARNVIATACLRHVPFRWRIRSCAGLAAQIGLLAIRRKPGSLAPIRSGLVDGFKGRLGPAPLGAS